MERTVWLSKCLSILIAFFAALVLVGWQWDISVLKRIVPGMTAMNPVTAVCFILCAFRLRLILSRQSTGFRWLRIALTLVILLVGVGKLMEYLQLHDFHFDRLLFTAEVMKEPGFNAIAPNTAILFLLAGILFLNTGRSPRTLIVNDILRLLALLIAYLGIIGYAYSIRTTYQLGPFVPMALITAGCFILVFFNTILTQPRGRVLQVMTSDLVGGRLARRAIPFLLLLPAGFGYVRVLGERAGLYESDYGTAVFTAFFVLTILAIVYLYAAQLNKTDLEQKVTALRTQESEERYRMLVDTMREGVIYFRKNGTIVFCNKGFTEISGYVQADIAGKNLIDLIPCAEAEVLLQQPAAGSPHAAEGFDCELQHKLGYPVWVSVTGRPVFRNGSEAAASFVTLTDITARKKIMEELNSFTAVAAHDLNAPLSRIEILASLLQDEVLERLSADEKEYLTHIIETAVRGKLMLKELLRFAKLSASALEKQTVSLEKMVRDSLELVRHLNPRAQVRIDEMPEVLADGPALQQVYANLISNALKFSAKKEHPEVHIGYYEEDGRRVFFVRDNGAGFDMSKAPQLFSPFQRMHADFEGNGLGLPIVKRIVEKHGGRIWAEAEKGVGASFYFTL